MSSADRGRPFSRQEFIHRAGITGAGLFLLSMLGLPAMDAELSNRIDEYYAQTRAYIEAIPPSQIAKLRNNPLSLYNKNTTDCYDDLPWNIDLQLRNRLSSFARFSPYLFSRDSKILASGSILKVAGSYVLASTVHVLESCIKQGAFFAAVPNNTTYGIVSNGYQQSLRNPLLAYIPIENDHLINELDASTILPIVPDLEPVDNSTMLSLHPLKDAFSMLAVELDARYQIIDGHSKNGEGIYTNIASVSIGSPTFALDSLSTPIRGMIYGVPDDPTGRIEAETGLRSSTHGIAIMPLRVQDFTDSKHVKCR